MAKSSCKPSSRRPKFLKRYSRIEDLPIVNRHAAGIDPGGDVSRFVAIEIGDELEARGFGGMTPDLHALAEYLTMHKVTTVDMVFHLARIGLWIGVALPPLRRL